MEGDTMIHVDDRISAKRARPETRRSQPLNLSQLTIGERIAQAAHAFELRRTKNAREWIAVFMNEDTIVIALHGSLTAAEKALAQSPAGAAQVREFHRQMFTNASAVLLQKIKNITGMEVRDTTVEIEPTTGHVVQIFTTDTVREEFLCALGGPNVRNRHSKTRHVDSQKQQIQRISGSTEPSHDPNATRNM
jgi:uncharacterized protein YbcI